MLCWQQRLCLPLFRGGGGHHVYAEDVTYTDAKTITKEGIYNFKAGEYNDQLIDFGSYNFSDNKDITVNIENNNTLKINRTGQWALIDVYNGADTPDGSSAKGNITINGNLQLNMDCENKETRNDARAINLLNNNDEFEINGNTNIEINNVKTQYKGLWVDGIRAFSGTMKYNGNFTIDKINASNVNAQDSYSAVTGVYSTTIGTRMSTNSDDGLKSYMLLGSVDSNEIKIQNINATSESGFLSVIGIVSEGNNSLVDVNGKLDIENLQGTSNNAHVETMALVANNKGVIKVNGDLTIDNLEGTGKTNEVVALQTYDGGEIHVNMAKDTSRVIQITGDIDGGDSNAGDVLTLNLLNQESFIKGASTGNVKLDLSNGATWYVQNRHKVNDADYDADKANSYISSLSGNHGVIQMDIDAGKNSGNPHLFIGELKGTHTLQLNNIGSTTDGASGNILASVASGDGTFTAPASEGGLYWTTYELGTQDSSETGYHTDWYLKKAEKKPTNPENPKEPAKPTTSVSTLLSTVTAGYDTWRNDMDKLNERMGELRMSGTQTEGIWARIKGSQFGRHGGNGDYTNLQHTYQLGYDTITQQNEKQTTYTGAALEYGKGSLSFASGTGTMRSFGLGLYQTRLRQSGHYLDFIYKFDKYKNDFHVADTAGNPISGKYGNNAMSVSAEYGRKNPLNHGWYVEPQSELTLGYMWGNTFTTSNNIRVEQKNMPALVGRLGVNVGRDIGDRATFYVKASINHDFLGNYDVRMTDLSTGDRLNVSDRFGSSWFDYGTGFTVKTSKNSYVYFDIERAVGGEYKKHWDWNAGMRWSF